MARIFIIHPGGFSIKDDDREQYIVGKEIDTGLFGKYVIEKVTAMDSSSQLAGFDIGVSVISEKCWLTRQRAEAKQKRRREKILVGMLVLITIVIFILAIAFDIKMSFPLG